jgi:hypothetical protein
MVWALLAILGVPIWLVLGALIGGYLSRRRFLKSSGVFPMRMRPDPSEDAKWSGKLHGRWIHDVMLLNTGYAKVRTQPHGCKQMVGPPKAIDATAVKGLDEPMSFVLILDDDSEVEIAVARNDLSLATGPY